MRLRNIPRAESVLAESMYVIKNPEQQRGKWKELFGNDNPIRLEIGMGKGKFLMKLAAENPDINYIGIERYSSVLLRAVEKLQKISEEKGKNVPNLRFLCIDAAEITEYFAEREVDKIYLNFSDPWPKARHARRRLTSREFFGRYFKILKSGHDVEFKTDNEDLFLFSLEEVEDISGWDLVGHTFDLHHDPKMNQNNVMTEYEEKFSSIGNPIKKLIARRKG